MSPNPSCSLSPPFQPINGSYPCVIFSFYTRGVLLWPLECALPFNDIFDLTSLCSPLIIQDATSICILNWFLLIYHLLLNSRLQSFIRVYNARNNLLCGDWPCTKGPCSTPTIAEVTPELWSIVVLTLATPCLIQVYLTLQGGYLSGLPRPPC